LHDYVYLGRFSNCTLSSVVLSYHRCLTTCKLFFRNLSATFSIPLSQIVGRLFVDCKAPDQINQQLAFITEQINRFRRHIFDILPILGRPPIDIAVCIPSGPQALFILRFGQCLEFFVDAVVFFDIFIWFFTGDIDVDTHAIIPKPFFTRCVLPGTLVQVLDHPTLPDLLPGLVSNYQQLIFIIRIVFNATHSNLVQISSMFR
jgi:hypothetical protein